MTVDVWEFHAAYALHSYAHPDFYDAPEHLQDSSTWFAETARPTPEGWRRELGGVWVGLAPDGASIPPQGWKIHVSGTLANASRNVNLVWEHCVSRRISFKFLRSRTLFMLMNAKEASRGSSGKLLTLYPTDEEELERTLRDLGVALEGEPGPYILSDLRYGSGPLYVRYGGFLPQSCYSSEGDLVPAISMPNGALVPDVRGPVFDVPAWVRMPSVLDEHIAARRSGSVAEWPYEIVQPLHFSNGGGVYLAQERATGRHVVIKEARPHAGLDGEGNDAIARLLNERSTLEQLAGLSIAPALLDYFEAEGHHFLVMEHLEEPLMRAMSSRFPFVSPYCSDREITEYAEWAMKALQQIRNALEAMHDRGIAFGDFHPDNIMLRPDGTVAFIDFETALPVDGMRRAAIGAAGFAAPATLSGADRDRYGFACVQLWMFLPTSVRVLHREPHKAPAFLTNLAERFGLPEEFVAEAREGLSLATPSLEVAADTAAADLDWPALKDSIVRGILANATPERADRLFPGDVAQFQYGGLNLAYGAAGVLYALASCGIDPDPAHVDWLVRATKRAQGSHAGLYNGLHGVAYVLDRLGRTDDALEVVERARTIAAGLPATGLFGGLSGIALSLLHFWRRTGDDGFRRAAVTLGEQVGAVVRDESVHPDRRSSAGLMYGFTGPALLFVHLYETTEDRAFLDLAAVALRRDLERCEYMDHDILQVRDLNRLMPYLAIGSAGIALVIDEYLRHADDDQFRTSQRDLRRACESELNLFPGLFSGRAGLIACLAGMTTASDDPAIDPTVDLHVRRLMWHAVDYRGGLVFYGDQALRLSLDLATGSAGVLLALETVYGSPPDVLPFIRSRRDLTELRPANRKLVNQTRGGEHP